MKRISKSGIWMSMALSAFILAACSSSQQGASSSSSRTASSASSASSASPAVNFSQASPQYFVENVGDRVFFETDKSRLDGMARASLRSQATWLKQNDSISLTVEGHADERGTREYNLALGARRANAVRDFLIAQGIGRNRLETISYGKERPVSVCSEESCWSQNRRSVSAIR